MSKARDTGNLVSSNSFFVNVASDNIGIGTTNPQATLQVGTAVSVYGNSGIVSATKFYGDGSELSGISGGGGIGTVITYSDGTPSPFSYIDAYVSVNENLNLNTTVAGASTSYIVSTVPNIEIAAGVAVTVGLGKTMIIDILQIGDL